MARQHKGERENTFIDTIVVAANTASWYCSLLLLAIILLSSLRQQQHGCRGESGEVSTYLGGEFAGRSIKRPCDELYVVREGETLGSISNKCGDPFIVERNPHIHDPDDVFPGLVIQIIPYDPQKYLRLLHCHSSTLLHRLYVYIRRHVGAPASSSCPPPPKTKSQRECDTVHCYSKMVNFGKSLKADQIQEWSGYYINYKLMKRKVKQHAVSFKDGSVAQSEILTEFSRKLDDQIEKMVLFILEQQGLLASRIEKLSQKRVVILDKPDQQEIYLLRQAFREIGEDLLKLILFVDMNATAIRKILKKFDKRLEHKFTDHYVTTRANHPYSQLQQVLKHVGISAVIGALTRNLADLQDNPESMLSIYDQPSNSALKDPVIEAIRVAVDKVTNTTNLIQYLGQHALIPQGDLPIADGDVSDKKTYHLPSLLLNLANAFLYMINTYIIVPTADDYATSLGAAATTCGIIIGSMAVAQIFSSVYFSAWSNKSYFHPLVFSSMTLLFGNVLYAFAYDANSITLLLMGRLLCGLGSARAVNRRYISDCVPLKQRMQASAGFVSASALGMACGPALAGLLQADFKIHFISINSNTLPGWVMGLAWLVYLPCLWIFFKEPERDTEEKYFAEGDAENGFAQPLLLNLVEEKIGEKDEDRDCDESEESVEDSHGPVNSIASAYGLLTPSVKVQLLIYFMLKFAMEILLSASSVISTFYFDWTVSNIAVFLALLGLTVLPVNILVGSCISNIFKERQILLVSEIIVLIGILLSFNVISSYTVWQYVISALITFVAAQVLEGVNLSLLSHTMSCRLSKGTYNGGLLSTEAGTLARVAADVTITLTGYLGVAMLLNITLIPSLALCVVSIVATCFIYNSLY